MFDHITFDPDDGRRTRQMLVHYCTSIERKLELMALNTKDILAKLQAQSTQIDGVLALCDTLHSHLADVINRLNNMGVDTADLQAMSDLLDSESSKIATAITSDADISEGAPAPEEAPPVPEGTPPAPTTDEQPAPTETPTAT